MSLKWWGLAFYSSILTIQNGQVMYPALIQLYGRPCTNHTGPVPRFSDSRHRNYHSHIAEMFEIEYGGSFLEAINTEIAEDFQPSKFRHGASKTSCFWHVRVAKLLLQCPNALCYLEKKASDVFGVTNMQYSLLLTASSEDPAFLLMAEHRYVTSPNKPKGEFLAKAFYRETLQ